MKSSAGDLSGRPQSIVDKPPTLGSRQSPQVPARPAEQQQQQQRNKPPVPVRAPVQAPTVRSSDSKPPMSPIAADSEYKSIQCPRFIMENDFRKFVKMFEKEDSDQYYLFLLFLSRHETRLKANPCLIILCVETGSYWLSK